MSHSTSPQLFLSLGSPQDWHLQRHLDYQSKTYYQRSVWYAYGGLQSVVEVLDRALRQQR